jgi:hypothetical protein
MQKINDICQKHPKHILRFINLYDRYDGLCCVLCLKSIVHSDPNLVVDSENIKERI